MVPLFTEKKQIIPKKGDLIRVNSEFLGSYGIVTKIDETKFEVFWTIYRYDSGFEATHKCSYEIEYFEKYIKRHTWHWFPRKGIINE